MRSRRFRLLLTVLLVAVVGVALAARTCPNCGESNRDDARFCKNCGYRFPARTTTTPTRSLPQLRATVEVTSGAVSIQSSPSGASVRVDYQYRGTTPLEVTDLEPGQHNLELSRSGYRDYDGIFVVPKIDGTVVVTTVPSGAEILLDDEVVGTAGDSGLVLQDISYGDHLLLARLAGYPDEVRQVQVSPASPVILTTISFAGRVGFLRVESDPVGASIEANDEPLGNTNFIGTIEPDGYQLRLKYPGFRDWLGSARVYLRDTAYVFATMTPLRERKPAFLWLGVAGVAGGLAGVVMGELSYREYQEAAWPEYSSEEIAQLRQNTQMYDIVRNVAGALGVLSLGAYLAF